MYFTKGPSTIHVKLQPTAVMGIITRGVMPRHGFAGLSLSLFTKSEAVHGSDICGMQLNFPVSERKNAKKFISQISRSSLAS